MREETVYEYITDEETVTFQCRAEMAQYLNQEDINESAILRITATDKFGSSSIDEENVENWLKRYKRHYPMLQNPNSELQKRLCRVRVLAEDKELTAKEIWETYYRGQIDALISGDTANYVAALSLMIPCMDRVYTLLHPKCDRDEVCKPNLRYGRQMFEMFFPAFGFDKPIYDYLNKNLRNGVIHDSFMRGDIGIDDSFTDTKDYSDSSNVFHQLINSDRRILLLVAVPWFWERVKTRIDRFYKHEQWLPGWDMHQMVRIDHSAPDEEQNRDDSGATDSK